ncbi:MAG TPA: immunoglobulin domain-containing protein [Verrucomicrobiae bacterium]|jgi:hypothetical protein|nr:immunoglobulin domain-containing protein [Verrucomicrobiae bacterium]
MNPNKFRNHAIAILMAACLADGAANGAPVTVANYSFEADVQSQGSESGPPITGWTASGSFEAVRYPAPGEFASDPLPAPADGHQLVELNANSLVYQDVGPLQPLTTYTLTVAIGERTTLGYAEGPGLIALINGTNEDGMLLSQTTVNNTGLDGTFTNFSVAFTTAETVSGDLTIVLETTTAIQISFDNVLLDAIAAGLIPVATTPTFSPPAAYPGDIVIATEAATGPAPLYYEWQGDNGSGGATWSAAGPFSATPTFTINTSGDTNLSYEYRVVVSNSSGAVTSPPGTLIITNGAPIVLQNPTPQVESFTVGDTASFSAAFDGTRPMYYQWQADDGSGPVNVTDGSYNSNTLVITNLQMSDAALAYTCIASNSYGTTVTTSFATLNVDALPGPDAFGNIVIEDNESSGASYQPTYVLATNSLIANQLPSVVGPGDFQLEGSAGIPILTDGLYPPTGDNYDIMATVGDDGGTTLTYNLNTAIAPLGYDLTSIVAYGGWLNGGRDQMAANLYYSTVTSPTNFIQFDTYDFTPPYAANPASQVTVLPSTEYLATNVAAVEFDFTGQDVENGYEGLSELQILGQAAPVPAVMIQRSGANIVLTWSSGVLVGAGAVNGPYTPVGSASPYTTPLTNVSRFFKLLIQ